MIPGIIHEQGNCLDIRDDISANVIIFHRFSNKFLVSCALISESIVIADNKPMDFCYRCYK